MHLILASESPRRKELLEKHHFVFQSFPVKVSEIPDKNLNVDDQILDIARRKAWAARLTYSMTGPGNFLFLSADTMVVLDNTPLGKPKDTTEAAVYLSQLSGKTHEVKTAVCLIETPSEKLTEFIVTTEVEFHNLTQKQIEDYISTGEPMDKAGAYAIQGLGRAFVKEFRGSLNNVIGLPTEKLIETIEKNKWKLLKSVSK